MHAYGAEKTEWRARTQTLLSVTKACVDVNGGVKSWCHEAVLLGLELGKITSTSTVAPAICFSTPAKSEEYPRDFQNLTTPP